MKKKDVELLKKVHHILLDVLNGDKEDLLDDLSPTSLRLQADRIEHQENVLREFGKFMEQFESLEPF